MGKSNRKSGMGVFLMGLGIFWFGVVLAGSLTDFFQGGAGGPSPVFLLAVLFPPFLFAGGVMISGEFRSFVLALDLRWVTLLHLTRFIGIVFLVLHHRNQLPGVFALPAGWGDIIAAVSAPFALWALYALPEVGRKVFISWNFMGLLDFAVALTVGTLVGIVQADIVSTEIMERFPLSLIPTFAVPLLTILHFTALLQVWKKGKRVRNSLVPTVNVSGTG